MKDMTALGNQTTGLPVIGMTIPGLQMLGGSAKTHTAWMVATPLNLASHPTHVVLDLGSLSEIEGFNKHAWYYLRRNSAVATILFGVCQLRDRILKGMLHYPLSNYSTMFYQG